VTAHVLAVLEDRDDDLWLTFDHAVALAEAERARLTLAKTTDPGRLFRWFLPWAMGAVAIGALCAPADSDPKIAASHSLARVAEFVPQDVPVTTLLLGGETQRALRALVRDGSYDALVAPASLLRRCPKLTRELCRYGVRPVAVRLPARAQPTIEIGASS
jgi:hypothetical protein